jgi:hypothetical protein
MIAVLSYDRRVLPYERVWGLGPKRSSPDATLQLLPSKDSTSLLYLCLGAPVRLLFLTSS